MDAAAPHRHTKSHALPIIGSLMVLMLAGCDNGSSEASPTGAPSGSASTASLTVTSSIADGEALTVPTPWIADVTAASSEPVNRVEFLVDGDVTWTERAEPYTFNDDGELLIPWVFDPGDHLLAIDVYTRQGVAASWSGTVSTTRPTVPKQLEGQAFTRETERQGCELCGLWRLEFGADGVVRIDDPAGGQLTDTFEATPDGTITFYGPASWTVTEIAGGGFCEPVGVVPMRWEMDGSDLVLSTGSTGDPCPPRAKLLAGTWRAD